MNRPSLQHSFTERWIIWTDPLSHKMKFQSRFHRSWQMCHITASLKYFTAETCALILHLTSCSARFHNVNGPLLLRLWWDKRLGDVVIFLIPIFRIHESFLVSKANRITLKTQDHRAAFIHWRRALEGHYQCRKLHCCGARGICWARSARARGPSVLFFWNLLTPAMIGWSGNAKNSEWRYTQHESFLYLSPLGYVESIKTATA